MITVKVRGGLGNQLFICAFAQALKHHYKQEVRLFTGNYLTRAEHEQGLELDKLFDLGLPMTEDYDTILPLRTFKNKTLSRLFSNPFWNFNHKYVKEKTFRVKSHVFDWDLKGDVLFDGLWQNSSYFENIRPEILKIFRFVPELDDRNKELINKIENTNSVSIHVRRGDYANIPLLADVCNIEYYQKAIDYMEEHVENPQYYVFSDNIDWVKENLTNLSKKENVSYIDYNTRFDSYKDMQVMSHCRHNIIANSTFSWWAAWLNQNEEKIVLAPKRWFNHIPKYSKSKNDRHKNNKIVPPNWIKISNP